MQAGLCQRLLPAWPSCVPWLADLTAECWQGADWTGDWMCWMALMQGERQASSGLAPVTAMQEVRLMEHHESDPRYQQVLALVLHEGHMGLKALHHITEQVRVEPAPSGRTF